MPVNVARFTRHIDTNRDVKNKAIRMAKFAKKFLRICIHKKWRTIQGLLKGIK